MNIRLSIVLGMGVVAAALIALVGARGSTVTLAANPCADLDADGVVTRIDLEIETSYFFQDVPPPPKETDQTGDGLVRIADINAVASQVGDYFLTCNSTPIGFNGPLPAKDASPADTDGDGCPDVDENDADETAGGMRDYLDPWDYANPQQDGLNRVKDISLVVTNFGVDYPAAGYNINLDRTLVGPESWRTGPPDGLIRVPDITRAVASFAHDC